MKDQEYFFKAGSPERRELSMLVYQVIFFQGLLTVGVFVNVWWPGRDLIADLVKDHVITTLLSVGFLIWRLRRINRMLSAFDASYANSTSAQVAEPRNDG